MKISEKKVELSSLKRHSVELRWTNVDVCGSLSMHNAKTGDTGDNKTF